MSINRENSCVFPLPISEIFNFPEHLQEHLWYFHARSTKFVIFACIIDKIWFFHAQWTKYGNFARLIHQIFFFFFQSLTTKICDFSSTINKTCNLSVKDQWISHFSSFDHWNSRFLTTTKFTFFFCHKLTKFTILSHGKQMKHMIFLQLINKLWDCFRS